jgi:putative toxin-antitoxin system antitoxin component (TIGR02293 family)
MPHILAVGPRGRKPGKTHPPSPKTKTGPVREPAHGLSRPSSPEVSSVIHQIKKGFTIDKFERLKEEFGVNREKLADVASISLATLHRRKVSMRRLSPDESEKIYRLEKLYNTAVEVLGDKTSVRSWFGTPHVVFEGKTPLEYADTLPGAEEVERVLRRIEHGVVL